MIKLNILFCSNAVIEIENSHLTIKVNSTVYSLFPSPMLTSSYPLVGRTLLFSNVLRLALFSMTTSVKIIFIKLMRTVNVKVFLMIHLRWRNYAMFIGWIQIHSFLLLFYLEAGFFKKYQFWVNLISAQLRISLVGNYLRITNNDRSFGCPIILHRQEFTMLLCS